MSNCVWIDSGSKRGSCPGILSGQPDPALHRWWQLLSLISSHHPHELMNNYKGKKWWMRKEGRIQWQLCPQLKLQLTKKWWWLKNTVSEKGHIKDDLPSKTSSGQKERGWKSKQNTEDWIPFLTLLMSQESRPSSPTDKT